MSSRTAASSRCRRDILELGFAYLATQTGSIARVPLMKELSERAARNPARPRSCRGPRSSMWRGCRRAASCRSAVSVGSRLPAFHSSMGRVQLGFLDDAEIWRRLKSVAHRALYAEHDHRPAGAVRSHPRRPRAGLLDRRRGARARPALDRRAGRRSRAASASPALNLCTHATRTTRNEMREQFLPALSVSRIASRRSLLDGRSVLARGGCASRRTEECRDADPSSWRDAARFVTCHLRGVDVSSFGHRTQVR